jgi:tetraacyldisaccharide 4'-kinase
LVTLRYHGYRSGLFSARKLSIPVISIGNLSVGGTGKTPTTLFLAQSLQEHGKRVAILSRGYRGAAANTVNVVSDGDRVLLSPDEAGDEPMLLAEHLPGVPVLTGKDRGRVGEYAQEYFSAEVAVLDDGFQHLRLRRDMDIVLVDQKKLFGNGYLLPRGPLRESPRSLRRAHIVLVTQPPGETTENRDVLEARIHSYHPTIPVFYAHYAPVKLTTLAGEEEISCDYLKGKRVVALAGVGRPGSFSGLLAGLGADVVETRFYPDHHYYQAVDVEGQTQDALIVTTEKDAVKLKFLDIKEKNIWVLSITLVIEQETAFFACLRKCLPSVF